MPTIYLDSFAVTQLSGCFLFYIKVIR
jgi:hypothetical protein